MTKLTRSMTAFAMIACALPSAFAEESDTDELARVINVIGEGEATAAPDMATVSTGVSTQADKARAALDQNNATMKKLLAILEEHGVAEKDVQTVHFSVSPVYDRGEEGTAEPKVVGYRVENQVQVRVRKLDSLGQVLDALVSAGSNQISSISFGVDDPSDLLNEARRKAIANARERAEVYARTADVVVGPIVQIREQSMVPPQPMRMGRMAYSAEAVSVPIATGEQEYGVSVNVIYELRRTNGE